MNRREFLKLNAAGALGTLVVNSVSCGSTPRLRKDVRLSTSSILYKDLTVEQACGRIADLGFDAIDIWDATEGCPHLDDVAQRLGGQGLRELLEQHHLKLFSISTFTGGYAKYAKVLKEAGGGVAVQGSAPPCKPEERKQRMTEFMESLKPLADTAGSNDSWLAIANESNALLSSLDSIKAFVDSNSNPRVGIALAPYHLQALGVTVTEAIHAAGTQILFFYGWQNAVGLKQLPGFGPADFRPWLDALTQERYRGYVNPFMRGYVAPDTLSASLARARSYLLRPG